MSHAGVTKFPVTSYMFKIFMKDRKETTKGASTKIQIIKTSFLNPYPANVENMVSS